ncbi:hypothetical protein F8M41_022313 [Gigaspora margarita]|uniref:Uncharacterized protein n=1 Tax=Gigaspora margarita TaxID=4874 RepID=A0A8H4AF90_GIGMA|nr:hypothetical protein F8M41_022313 [Gigaspora margarita]
MDPVYHNDSKQDYHTDILSYNAYFISSKLNNADTSISDTILNAVDAEDSSVSFSTNSNIIHFKYSNVAKTGSSYMPSLSAPNVLVKKANQIYENAYCAKELRSIHQKAINLLQLFY